MNTYTLEEIEEYLTENNLIDNDFSIHQNAIDSGFSYDQDIDRYIPL